MDEVINTGIEMVKSRNGHYWAVAIGTDYEKTFAELEDAQAFQSKLIAALF